MTIITMNHSPFILTIKQANLAAFKLEVNHQVSAGLDPRNDLVLIHEKVQTRHFVFENKSGVLTLTYLGLDGDSFLDHTPLLRGKFYILENGDHLQVGDIEITIGEAIAPRPTALTAAIIAPLKTETLPKDHHEMSLQKKHGQIEQVVSLPEKKIEEKTEKTSTITIKTGFKRIPYKIYGFLLDISLTYFVLGFIIPKLGLLKIAQDLFLPIDQALTQIIRHSTLINYLPVFEFAIYFHVLMISTSLILGTTPGAFLIGFHHKDNDKSLFAIRFKAYIYALLNVFTLPIIIFDIPLLRGKTTKEWITFYERELTSTSFFKFSRTFLAPLIFIICFLSPFFLPIPYSSSLTEERLLPAKYKSLHTNVINSHSASMGISLHTELSSQYGLLPHFEKNHLGFILYDSLSKNSLILTEEQRITHSRILYELRFASPLLQMPKVDLKKQIIHFLHYSVENFSQNIMRDGPFLANGFLLKSDFFNGFSSQDNFLINLFDAFNPCFILTSRNESRLFLVTQNEIIVFHYALSKNSALIESFNTEVANNFVHDEVTSRTPNPPQLLEVFEAFLQKDTQTILTYYINEAKKADEKKNLDWSLFLKKNIIQTKQVLSGSMNKNTERSFDTVINSL